MPALLHAHAAAAPPRSRLPLAAAALAVLVACIGCASAQTPAPPAGDSVAGLIGEPTCDTDAQCATIGVGAKACGGPAEYVAWSLQRTDAERLRRAAEREARAARDAVAASGRMSNCAVASDPGAFCDRSASGRGVCRLRALPSGPLVR